MLTSPLLLAWTLAAPPAAAPAEPPVAPPKGAAPIAEPASFTLEEDGTLTHTLSAVDPDGDPVVFVVATPPKRGKLTADRKTGAFTYAPQADFHGEDSFKFWASDGKLVGSAVVTLTITPVDDPPIFVSAPALLTLLEDGSSTAKLVARDVDGDAISFRVAAPASHGEATVDAQGTVRFAPAADWSGDDAFAIEAVANAATASADLRVVVSPINDAPKATAANLDATEDQPLTGTLVGSDIDGDKLSYRVAVEPKRGSVKVDGSGAFTYTPWQNAHGEDSFSFAVSDGKLAGTAPVTLKVAPVDDPPAFVGAPPTVRGLEDSPATARLGARDLDGDALGFRVSRAPTHGEASVDAQGLLRFTPAAHWFGDDSLEVEVAAGGASARVELAVQVAPVNDAPLATAASHEGVEDQVLGGSVGGTDLDGEALSYRVVSEPKRGSVKLDEKTGAFRYTPWKDLHGDDAFGFAASDGKLFGTATVALKVAPADDPPVFVGAPFGLKTAEDTRVVGKLGARDLDGDALSFRVARPAAHGEASVDGAGQITFVPAPNFHGADAFAVEVSAAGATALAEVALTVTPASDPPVVDSTALAELPEDTSYTGTLPARDPDGDPLSFRILGAPRLGSAVLEDAKAGRYKYTPRANVHGDDEVGFEVVAGGQRAQGVARVRIVAVNDAPAVSPAEATTREDQPVELRLKGEDIDGDKLGFEIARPPVRGSAVMADKAAGVLRVTPGRDDAGAIELEVIARDGSSSSRPAKVIVRVQGENDAPVLSSLRLQTPEDVPLTRKLAAVDADGDKLTFRVGEPTSLGEVRVGAEHDGTFTFNPRKNASGTGVFTLIATDAQGASGSATVTVVVTPVDDPPVAVGTRELASRVGRMNGRLVGHDPEGTRVRFRIATQPSLGEVELLDEKSGEYAFITRGGGTGQTRFTFEVLDEGGLVSAPGIVEVLVR